MLEACQNVSNAVSHSAWPIQFFAVPGTPLNDPNILEFFEETEFIRQPGVDGNQARYANAPGSSGANAEMTFTWEPTHPDGPLYDLKLEGFNGPVAAASQPFITLLWTPNQDFVGFLFVTPPPPAPDVNRVAVAFYPRPWPLP